MKKIFGVSGGYSSSGEDNGPSSWGSLKHLVMYEMKRAVTGVEKIETELKDVSKEISSMQNKITQLTASPQMQIVRTQLETIKGQISTLEETSRRFQRTETQAKFAIAIFTFLFSAGLTAIGIFIS